MKGITFSLKSSKKKYAAKESIPLEITLTNNSKEAVTLKDFGAGLLSTYYLGFRGFKIEGKKKEEAWFMGAHIAVKAAHVYNVVTIAPGKSWSDEVDFRDWKQLNSQPLESGTYEIVATWKNTAGSLYGAGKNEIEGEFTSNSITISF
jgi:hypothetical protein